MIRTRLLRQTIVISDRMYFHFFRAHLFSSRVSPPRAVTPLLEAPIGCLGSLGSPAAKRNERMYDYESMGDGRAVEFGNVSYGRPGSDRFALSGA